jgi:hypothetical protein
MSNRLALLSPFERNVVVMARRTEGDWQAVAQALGKDAETCREVFEKAKAKLTGKPAQTAPPAPPMTRRTEMETPQAERPTDDVLADALRELEARRDAIAPQIATLKDELKRVDKAIATLRRATGMTARDARTTNGGSRLRVPAELREQIIAALDPDGPTDRTAIAKAVDRKEGPYFYGVLSQLCEHGDIVQVDGGYALPAGAVAAA